MVHFNFEFKGRGNVMNSSDNFSFTPQYLTKNGEPWFPVMGEIHYSRYPEKFWKESLLKMKSGGVTIVSAYTIWIHHEEIENEWDFSGQRNLRKFVETVKECGLYMILRIGPWCHGEVRNGGFPDWLMQKGFEPRTNDERYFAEVRKFYQKIFSQVEGLLLKDGGPIVGVQIENEFGHCGGLSGKEGELHMTTLKNMAVETGFTVPLYTATGWGGAITAGMLPVMGGYVDAPWDQRPAEIEPSGNFVITHERNDHNIGSDFGFGTGITFDMTKFPYLTAELGGGLEPTFLRRPVPVKSDIGAETLVKLASGVNLLGYYMYHGGTNPYGKKTTLQESKATGSLNDLPELSYDFFAPVREYGQISPVYGELKLFALFAADFGSSLCKMKSIINQDNPLAPDNKDAVRYSFRVNQEEKSGYLFVNNYVRHQKQTAHKARKFECPVSGVEFPALDVNDGDYYFLPFNMKIGNGLLKTALASPLCKLNGNKACGKKEAFVFYKTVACRNGKEIFNFETKPTDTEIILISREEAERAYKITIDGTDYLFISDAVVLSDGKNITLMGKNTGTFMTYPELPKTPFGYEVVRTQNGFTVYQNQASVNHVSLNQIKKQLQNSIPAPSFLQEEFTQDKAFYNVTLPDLKAIFEKSCEGSNVRLSDIRVNIFYNGSYARLYKNERLAADNLFCGKQIPWQIGLRNLYEQLASQPGGAQNTMQDGNEFLLEIQALKQDEKVYIEDMPEFKDGKACSLKNISVELIFSSDLKLS